jgi:tetraprenyl-beta-curcumene synthase
MSVPIKPIRLMSDVYRKILPTVHKELSYWEKRARLIPDPELRKQALASIKTKTFHCEGGSILALMANDHYRDVIRFIVAYQTISDYLDNLCDRSTSLDPDDFASLHKAMEDALTVGNEKREYYEFRSEREDGEYLADLAATCREVLENCQHYLLIKNDMLELCGFYCDLQIHKHVVPSERVSRLKKWFEQHKTIIPEMEWFEFSASAGSTLGIFCLVSYAFRSDFEGKHAESIRKGYFPYIQGLHILLDYFVDQDEDLLEGDLNFCFYYKNDEHLSHRLKHFMLEADRNTSFLPHKQFHQLINRGLLAIYLSDEKVRKQDNIRKLAKEIIKAGGPISSFFYLNAVLYRWFQNKKRLIYN